MIRRFSPAGLVYNRCVHSKHILAVVDLRRSAHPWKAGAARRTFFRAATSLLTAVLVSISLQPLPALAGEPEEAAAAPPSAIGVHHAKGVRITGRVSFADGQPAPNAVVTAIHLESGKVFKAQPTHSSGWFEIPGAAYGYYLFAIEAKGVVHASRPPFNVPPGRSQDVILVLRAPQDQPVGVSIPGLEREATALADALEPKKSFFKKPAGVATIVGASLLTLLLH